jgi:hypothetical protein
MQIDQIIPKTPPAEDIAMPLSDLGFSIRSIILRNAGSRKKVKPNKSIELYIKNVRPVLQPEGVLELYDEQTIGKDGIPSDIYPSDHLAIAASFRLSWETIDGDKGSGSGKKAITCCLYL